MRMSKYVIVSVESKRPGHVNKWHERVTGKRCVVACLMLGWSATFRIEGLSPVASSTMFHTSPVVNVTAKDGVLTIETVNSVYMLKECKEND